MVLTRSRNAHAYTDKASSSGEAQTSAAGRVAVLPAGVGVRGVAPRSTAVTVRVPAKVGLQVCQRILLWRDTVGEVTVQRVGSTGVMGNTKGGICMLGYRLGPVRVVGRPSLTDSPALGS